MRDLFRHVLELTPTRDPGLHATKKKSRDQANRKRLRQVDGFNFNLKIHLVKTFPIKRRYCVYEIQIKHVLKKLRDQVMANFDNTEVDRKRLHVKLGSCLLSISFNCPLSGFIQSKSKVG